jgi:hypothetical protein
MYVQIATTITRKNTPQKYRRIRNIIIDYSGHVLLYIYVQAILNNEICIVST